MSKINDLICHIFAINNNYDHEFDHDYQCAIEILFRHYFITLYEYCAFLVY